MGILLNWVIMALNKRKLTISILKFSLSLGFLLFLLVYIMGVNGVYAEVSQKNALADSPKLTDAGQSAISDTDWAEKVVPKPPAPDKVVKAVITAYTSTPDQTDDSPFTAASGKHVYDGMIAANWLPFGTRVKIPSLYGDKVFTVDDRMNARYGYGRMDIWFDSSKGEAKKFGVKRVEVEIYYPDKTLALDD